MSLKLTIRPGGTGLCPMCREAISREAKKCPHCQSDLSANEQWQAEQSKAGCAPMIVLGFIIAPLVLAKAANLVADLTF